MDGSCAQYSYTITRRWTATDACGNVSLEFEQVITVQDTSVPVVDQDPGDLDRTIECSDPAALAAALALEPTFTDNCDATPGVQLVSSVSTQVMDGSCAQYSYTITRRWTATDACGNTSLEYQQVITVQDTSVPVVDQDPGDLDRTLECSDPAALAAALALVPTFTDNCDANLTPQLVSSVSTQVMDGSCAQYGYTITRRWRATDACGNTSVQYQQVITVQDTSVPVVDQDPGDLDRTIECSDPAALAAALALVPTFTDNCDANLTPQLVSSVSTQVMDGSCAQYGYTITRRWRATDACGNVSLEFEQVITVQDTSVPVVDQDPGDLDRTLECSDPAALAAALALEPTFTDNCDANLTPQLDFKRIDTGDGRVMRTVQLHHYKKVDGNRCLRQHKCPVPAGNNSAGYLGAGRGPGPRRSRQDHRMLRPCCACRCAGPCAYIYRQLRRHSGRAAGFKRIDTGDGRVMRAVQLHNYKKVDGNRCLRQCEP
jgi:large repetitive protein